ncbi:hypothetical protein [Diplocloster agilis]
MAGMNFQICSKFIRKND